MIDAAAEPRVETGMRDIHRTADGERPYHLVVHTDTATARPLNEIRAEIEERARTIIRRIDEDNARQDMLWRRLDEFRDRIHLIRADFVRPIMEDGYRRRGQEYGMFQERVDAVNPIRERLREDLMRLENGEINVQELETIINGAQESIDEINKISAIKRDEFEKEKERLESEALQKEHEDLRAKTRAFYVPMVEVEIPIETRIQTRERAIDEMRRILNMIGENIIQMATEMIKDYNDTRVQNEANTAIQEIRLKEDNYITFKRVLLIERGLLSNLCDTLLQKYKEDINAAKKEFPHGLLHLLHKLVPENVVKIENDINEKLNNVFFEISGKLNKIEIKLKQAIILYWLCVVVSTPAPAAPPAPPEPVFEEEEEN
jgi:hypothetical protein